MDYLARYAHPSEVLADATLEPKQKQRILTQWRLDALRKSDSRAEGMSGGIAPDLAAVDRALTALSES